MGCAKYVKTTLQDAFTIRDVISVHYFEYDKNFIFTGETHDFWELVYVDQGQVDILAEDRWIAMRQGQMVFHKPNEFHNVRANGKIAPNVAIVSFVCTDPAMKFFEHKILDVSNGEKHLLAVLIKEATKAFASPLGDPFLVQLERALPENVPLGAEQMVRLCLEQMLISMYRNNAVKTEKTMTVMRERMEKDIVADAVDYMNENVSRMLTTDMICRYLNVSYSELKRVFKAKKGMGVMAFFRQMKISRAKTMIREDNDNITQIAEKLGYENVHHFSRQFKQLTGMAPTEYGKSVKIELDRPM